MTPRERFLHYVTYYTTSDDFSETAPSTERQKELIRELAREMEELGPPTLKVRLPSRS